MTVRRMTTSALALALLLASATACKPAPVPVFRVNADGAAHDAAPDGVCEVTSGQGDCTMVAALDEANRGRGIIEVRGGWGWTDGAIVTGQVTVRAIDAAQRPAPAVQLDGVVIQPGASLTVVGLTPSSGDIEVHGRLVMERTGMLRIGRAIDVHPGGVAELTNVMIGGDLRNAGTLTIRWSTIIANRRTVIDTVGDGTTRLATTAVLQDDGPSGPIPACRGTRPAVLAYSVASDDSCLDGPSSGAIEAYDGSNLVPRLGSPRLDAIPVDQHGCATTPLDSRNRVRPVDGDQDGTPACDVGGFEAVGPDGA